MTAARIMVVEDERIVALHLRQQLLKLGYDVPAPIASGEVALEQVEHMRPDLVLMDIHVEGKLDGIETAALMGGKHRKPVIYLTAYAETATLDRAKATEPYGYLLKPFSERELHATIEMALARCQADKLQRDGEAALRQAQKMEAIGQLAGGVAHDFNNLLGVIIGNLDRITERELPDVELNEMVDDALRAAVRGASLTRQLLAYSRRQALDPRVLSLGRVVSDLTALLRRTLGETIQIRTQLPANLWAARLDLNQFENAVLNLAVNARDAMPGGGTLSIDLHNVEIADGDGDLAAGNYVLVTVADTGTGMTKDVADRAFEPFFTTKPVDAGTGLGLSMVYGFVKQSDGHVLIETAPGRGTTVKLYFPAVKEAAADTTGAAPPVTLPRAEPGETVLIVEDDAALRKLTGALLASLGYAAIETADGPAALQKLEEAARVDLLLTDIVLPRGMSGPDLARAAQDRRPGLRTLYMSGYAKATAMHGATLDEGAQLLMKPFRKADLARRVRLLLDGDGPA
jgi:signal transduction histidine kinase